MGGLVLLICLRCRDQGPRGGQGVGGSHMWVWRSLCCCYAVLVSSRGFWFWPGESFRSGFLYIGAEVLSTPVYVVTYLPVLCSQSQVGNPYGDAHAVSKPSYLASFCIACMTPCIRTWHANPADGVCPPAPVNQ